MGATQSSEKKISTPTTTFNFLYGAFETNASRSYEDRVAYGDLPELDFLRNLPAKQILEIIKDTITQLSDFIDKDPASLKSGSTLTGILQVPYFDTHEKAGRVGIFNFNVGDSRCYFVNLEKKHVYRPLQDHNFENSSEIERLKQFAAKNFAPEHKENISFKDEFGAERLHGAGINMTRALGDKAGLRYGLSREPDIAVFEISRSDSMVFVSLSDGFIGRKESDSSLFGGQSLGSLIGNHFSSSSFSRESIRSFCWYMRNDLVGPYLDDMTIVASILSQKLVRFQILADGHAGVKVAQIIQDKFCYFLKQAALSVQEKIKNKNLSDSKAAAPVSPAKPSTLAKPVLSPKVSAEITVSTPVPASSSASVAAVEEVKASGFSEPFVSHSGGVTSQMAGSIKSASSVTEASIFARRVSALDETSISSSISSELSKNFNVS